jgi:hypothetical protein
MRVLESEAKVSVACAGAQDKLLELAALETELSAACAEAQDMMLGMAAVGESSSFAEVSDVCGEAQDMLSRLSAQRFQARSDTNLRFTMPNRSSVGPSAVPGGCTW